jgi:hypothetical protein
MLHAYEETDVPALQSLSQIQDMNNLTESNAHQKLLSFSLSQSSEQTTRFWLLYVEGVPLSFSNSVPDRHWRKVNESTGSLWIIITIVLRHPFQSLHTVFKHGSQILRLDDSHHFTNCAECRVSSVE